MGWAERNGKREESGGPVEIRGFTFCGRDSAGVELVVYLPDVTDILITPGGPQKSELVTLLYRSGSTRQMNAEHSKTFLVNAGLRPPDTERIIIPDTVQRFPHGG